MKLFILIRFEVHNQALILYLKRLETDARYFIVELRTYAGNHVFKFF